MRDELWFIEFGRGAALPLTPEEAPADGEPVVPCAQGRIIVETARPAPPHFATCSTYRPRIGHNCDPSQVAIGALVGPIICGRLGPGKASRLVQNNRQQSTRVPDSPASATRPEDLGVTPWYLDEFGIGESSSSSGVCERGGGGGGGSGGGAGGSYPSSAYQYSRQSERSLVFGRQELYSTREHDSSIDSADATSRSGGAVGSSRTPRKAYMDLTDAMALLDETCPNQDQSASPSLTPRTPRTPLTPFPRNRRARSKSSDNSSNYSNEIACCDRTLETSKSQEKQEHMNKQRRPFLRKIGISKTEDRPFLAKIMAPRIIGKPYLEKIGPSRAVEKPYLEKIGSSRTLDRFTFDALRELPRAMVRRCQPSEPSPLTREHYLTKEEHEEDNVEDLDEDVIVVVKDDECQDEVKLEIEEETNIINRVASRRTNGKAYLLKMYSFETEDLNEANQAAMKAHRDPLRGASLDDVLDSGPSSFQPSEDSHEQASSRSDDRSMTSVAELVKCRVTTSEEIFSTSAGHINSPREVTSWGNSPRWPKRRSRRVGSASRTRTGECEQNSIRIFPSDESTPNSPTKRQISPETSRNTDGRVVVSRTKNSSLPRDLTGSPAKARRQTSEEPPSSTQLDKQRDTDMSCRRASEENICKDESRRDETIESEAFARCKSRRQTFKVAVEKFGGSETRRQVSEEILDRNRKNGESEGFDDPHKRFERRGISSDNLKLSRETVVASVPSTSSLGYQSGDSSLVSQRSSHHSQDFVRGTLKILHDKFELQDVPSESYAAFKRRTRANHLLHHHHRTTGIDYSHRDYSRNEETSSILLTTINNNNNNNSSNNNNNNNNNTRSNVRTNLEKENTDVKDLTTQSPSEETSVSRSSITTKSVLRKQDGVDHQSDHEMDTSTSLRRPKRRIINEPSQETMDLLTELRRVKSLLRRTPSIETDEINQEIGKAISRFPKKILLTDKEFCLSVERENSVRRRPSMIAPNIGQNMTEDDKVEQVFTSLSENFDDRVKDSRVTRGPALFEKRCLSLDYADEDKPPKPEARAISLASSRTPVRYGTEETLDSSDLAGLAYDARSYCSDVFTTPSDENEETRERVVTENSKEFSDERVITSTIEKNHCAEVDIAIPVDQVGSISPKRRIHIQARTSDLYEIISPRSTPFRVKKRLGRISVEETVKQESFTLSKVDCRSVTTQKKTKCFPL